MPKILILKGDVIEAEIELPNDRFVFVFTGSADGPNSHSLYHMDLANGNIFQQSSGGGNKDHQFSNLGKVHREIAHQKWREELNKPTKNVRFVKNLPEPALEIKDCRPNA